MIGLGHPGEIFREAGRPPNAQHEQTGRKRVQRARVADAPGAQRTARRRYYVMRGGAHRFVDRQDEIAGR